ncbi:MAG: hypothetical protein KGI80_03660 [Verrucomicrobiota bacterium]|nr:hypothetical protein [Verrucomicrobiota bacterium]
MLHPTQIEEAYQEFTRNPSKWIHDGVFSINLQFLHDEGLMDGLQTGENEVEDLTQFFHVIESDEKVTLFNEQFIVWIIPKAENEDPVTNVLIALNHTQRASLEIAFSTQGVYNTPKYVLKVLQHFLHDLLETEATVNSLEEKDS